MIRKLKQVDRPALETILRKTNNFHSEEVDVALELIDIALLHDGQSDYHIFVYEDTGRISGYHCTGKRPLTDGVYDLYWIVVDPEISGKGIGKKLMAEAEKFALKNKLHLMYLETGVGWKAVKFYESIGFKAITVIKKSYGQKDFFLMTKPLNC